MYEKISLAGIDNSGWLRLRKTGIGGSDAGADELIRGAGHGGRRVLE